ncbi:MAG: hypothetical protein O3A87_11780, partial [Verrucomicrobia bacterium]|nr:hypothetical protein [Verrucomicrobiota bacterium]
MHRLEMSIETTRRGAVSAGVEVHEASRQDAGMWGVRSRDVVPGWYGMSRWDTGQGGPMTGTVRPQGGGRLRVGREVDGGKEVEPPTPRRGAATRGDRLGGSVFAVKLR